ncbi:hypothetical protein LJC30_04715 [Odoribacter sp. OttesenSCG-928-L07]|nr:hypothetical protein [Odoribacter sp. OttesenSCG-928-L07]
MKRVFLVSICIIISICCRGQELKLTFSPTITLSQDTSVRIIASLWENYLEARYDDYLNFRRNLQYQRRGDLIQNLFWHAQTEDLLIGEIEKFMLFGELSTFSIRKYSKTIYEIHTLLQAKAFEGEGINTLFLYKVCAIETDNGFKFLNYFDVTKNSLQNYTSEDIDFYYPCGFEFDIEKVKETEKFLSQFRKDFNIEKLDKKIVCVVGNSLSESNAFIGFDFTIATSENKFAGYFLEPRTILTCRQDHIHEFVHVLIKSTYPNIYEILNEGIATYYGGQAGFDYDFHVKNLQKYLSENTVDFLNTSLLWDLEVEGGRLAYTVGALIVDYTLNSYGTPKVIELFSCKDYEEIFLKLEIPTEDVNNFFIRLINGKIEKY